VLVLTRKIKQSIMIGDDIEVTVLSNEGEKVRLGIQAPPTVPVHRIEIYRKIHAEPEEGGGREGQGLSSARGGRARKILPS
jgi:carbon storage regulator